MGWLVRVGGPREGIGLLTDPLTEAWWTLGTSGIAEVDNGPDQGDLIGGFVDEATARRAGEIAAGLAVTFDHQITVSVEPDAAQWGDNQWRTVAWRDHQIVLQPGEAFGHGAHPTTGLCLALLADLDLTDRPVLDIGSGTGILAIAAALGGADPVVAIDNDPAAIRSTELNAAANQAALVVGRTLPAGTLRSSDGATSQRDTLVLVNMLTTDLRAVLADPQLAEQIARTQTIVHSGFLNTAGDEATALFPHHHIAETRTATDGSGTEWGAYRWERE